MTRYITKEKCFWEGGYYKPGSIVETKAKKVPAYFTEYKGKTVEIKEPPTPMPPQGGQPPVAPGAPSGTRAALEEQAAELGITFDAKISDEDLADAIAKFKAR